MRLQDKLVDGRDVAHEESQQREDMEDRGEEQMPEALVEAVPDAGVKLRGELLGAIRMVLDGQKLELGWLRLPERETLALEALQAAVGARSSMGHFVYAEDRRDLLEQALAVLQPNMTRADDQSAYELHLQFADLAERVGELRGQLTNLEDAQDELIEGRSTAEVKDAAEPGDKPTPAPSDPDAPRPATTLTGPDRPEPAPTPTTLIGPDRPAPATKPTTLTGPDRPDPAPTPTTLTGPDRPAPATTPTTLTGPDRPDEPAPASTLGDAEELAAKAKQPWWRRPFGG